MITTYKYRDITWIDLESPTTDEIRKVREEWHINEVVSQELISLTLKPKVDLYRDYIYLVLHFPAIRHSHKGQSDQEIDFIIGKKFIITTHYDTVDPLHEFSKIFEVNSVLDRSDLGDHAGYIFYYMIKNIYKGMENELDMIKDRLALIETNTFTGKEKEMVTEISKVSRNLIDIKRAIRPHDDVLSSLQTAGLRFFGQDFDFHLKTIKDEFYRLEHELFSHSELLSELRGTNDSLLTTKQNETMKILSVVAFIGLPLSIFTALFQVNTISAPIVGRSGDFWILLGILIIMAIVLYKFSKYKKWL